MSMLALRAKLFDNKWFRCPMRKILPIIFRPIHQQRCATFVHDRFGACANITCVRNALRDIAFVLLQRLRQGGSARALVSSGDSQNFLKMLLKSRGSRILSLQALERSQLP